MASLSDKLSKLVAARCLAPRNPTFVPHDIPQSPSDNTETFVAPDLPLDFDFGGTDFLTAQDAFDLSSFLDQSSDQSPDTTSHTSDNKRKLSDADGTYPDGWKRAKAEPDLLDTFDSLFFSDFNPGMLATDHLPCDSHYNEQRRSPGSSESSADELRTFHRGGSVDYLDQSSPHSDASGVACQKQSAEYHFQQIQSHVELAVAALKRGHYQRSKNIVTWAHELKNKTVSEVGSLSSYCCTFSCSPCVWLIAQITGSNLFNSMALLLYLPSQLFVDTVLWPLDPPEINALGVQ